MVQHLGLMTAWTSATLLENIPLETVMSMLTKIIVTMNFALIEHPQPQPLPLLHRHRKTLPVCMLSCVIHVIVWQTKVSISSR